MVRFIVIVAPLLLTVGATAAALLLPLWGNAKDRFRTLLPGAIIVGLLFSGLAWWQQNALADQSQHDVQMAAQRAASDAAGKVNDTLKSEYEGRIRSLSSQLLAARSGSGVQPQTVQLSNSNNGPKLPKIFWEQQDFGSDSAIIHFKLYAPLSLPGFVAICDGPCRATRAQAGNDSEGIQVIGDNRRDVAGWVFKRPRPMPAGTEGYIVVQGGGKGVPRVTEFRALRELEIPTGVK